MGILPYYLGNPQIIQGDSTNQKLSMHVVALLSFSSEMRGEMWSSAMHQIQPWKLIFLITKAQTDQKRVKHTLDTRPIFQNYQKKFFNNDFDF